MQITIEITGSENRKELTDLLMAQFTEEHLAQENVGVQLNLDGRSCGLSLTQDDLKDKMRLAVRLLNAFYVVKDMPAVIIAENVTPESDNQ